MPKNYLRSEPKIAIIGGSGLEDPKFFKKIREIKVKTPFGFPSSPISIADFRGKQIAFLSRHGKKHQFPPHRVPQRANIWALKKIGIERIVGVSTVGSLQKDFKPGDIVILDQFVDFTKERDCTFFDKGAIHVSPADPFCSELRSLFYKEARKLRIPVHEKGTYWCIEGPRFSTRAESKFFKSFADVVGMTLVPEVTLAREAEICYLNLAMVTDYDVWQPHPVNVEEVLKTMKDNIESVKKLLMTAIPKIKENRRCFCKTALKNAKV